jgi:tetratricopeptide (TPR) repeat protein
MLVIINGLISFLNNLIKIIGEFLKYKEELKWLVKKGLKWLVSFVVIIIILLCLWIFIPCSQTIVLVADFDNETQKDYQVTENIVKQLRSLTSRYPEIKVQKLYRKIDDLSWVDRKVFTFLRKISIVIWGQYGVTSDHTQIFPHFEILKSLNDPFDLDSPVLKVDELKSFKLQIRLSEDMSYLTLLTLGIARNIVADWDGAIASFNDALDALTQIKEPILSLDRSKAYLYRADSYFHKEDYEKAIADYDQVLKLKPNLAGAYNDQGIAYKRQGNYIQAVLDYDQALNIDPDLAYAYSNRGLAYHEMGDYTQAVLDFNKALKINPNFPAIYYNRGNSGSPKQVRMHCSDVRKAR